MKTTLHAFPLKPLVIALAAAQCVTLAHATPVPTDVINDSSFAAPYLVSTDTLTITPDGVVSTGSEQFAVQNAQITTLIENQGTIYNQNQIALYNSGSLASLKNSGSITSTTGIAIENDSSIGTLINNGVINSDNFTGSQFSGIGIANFGTISSLNITENGIISGGQTAIFNRGQITTLNNDGYIGSFNPGLNAFTNNAITNSLNGAIGTINNSGTIAGNIVHTSSNELVINGGSDRRGQLTGANHFFIGPMMGNPTGQIVATGADVSFGGGMLLLNDNVDLGGSHTLTNSADVLVTQPLTISGNYHQTQDAILNLGVSDATFAQGSALDIGYGRLTVSGNALIDSGSTIRLSSTGSSYGFASGQRYLAISAGSATYNASALHYVVDNYNGVVTAKVVDNGSSSDLALYLDDPAPTPPVTPPTPPTPVTPAPPVTPTTPTVPVSPPTTPSEPVTPVTPVTPVIPVIPVTPTTPTAPVAAKPLPTTGNAIASINGLSSYSGFSAGLLDLFNASKTITTQAEANRIGEQLAPAQNSMASAATASASMDALGVVGSHLDGLRTAQSGSARGIATGDDSLDWAAWGKPFYGSARQGMTDNVSGYRAHYGGLVLGLDRQLPGNWRAGVALSYSRTSVKGADNLKGNSSDVDAWGGIAYASYTGEPWFVNLSTSLTRQSYESQRAVDFSGFNDSASSHFHGQQAAVKGEFGYPLALGDATVLTPLASMSYSYLHQGSYQESSDGGSALSVDSAHSQSIESSLGSKLAHSWSTGAGALSPFVQLMWTHQYDRSPMKTSSGFSADSIGETRFTTAGASPAKDSAEASIGATLAHADDLSLEARYDLQAAPHFEGQTISLQVCKLF